MDGDEAALGQEAVELVCLDPLIVEGVQDYQQEGAEVVDLGQVDVLDRVSHGQRVQPQLLGEVGYLVGVVGPCDYVDPYPVGFGQLVGRLNIEGALARLELQGPDVHRRRCWHTGRGNWLTR